MKKFFAYCVLLGILATPPYFAGGSQAYALSCLGPAQQRAAVASGDARPFGAIASGLHGELVNARLCKQGGRLIYVVTVLRGNKRVDVVFNARNGRRLR